MAVSKITASALLALASTTLAPQAKAADDRALGEYLAAECTGCHLAGGRQPQGIPAIAGWPEDQFIAVLNAYKSGQREHQVMQAIAARLSQDEIAALASYYGSVARAP
jgi:cytochrome c553